VHEQLRELFYLTEKIMVVKNTIAKMMKWACRNAAAARRAIWYGAVV
jgi:DNA-binding HxlR family transcriptional regulator